MKITTSQLRRIIAEEVKSSLNEATRTPDTLIEDLESMQAGQKITNVRLDRGGRCTIFKVGQDGRRRARGAVPAYIVMWDDGRLEACYNADEVYGFLGPFAY